MIWVCISVELILVSWILAAWIQEKKKGGCKEKKKGWTVILQPAGGRIARWFQPSEAKREKSQIYQIISRLAGEKEGKELFYRYRQKRWSMILGIVVLVNGLWVGQSLLENEEAVLLANEQTRPEYGEGDKREQVTVMLDGDETVQTTLSILIPEKKMSEAKAREKLDQGLAYIQEYMKNIKIRGDISLPAGWNEVTFYYESLTPDLISNNGSWLGEIRQEAQSAKLKVTAAVAGQSKTAEISLTTVTLSELSAEERLSLVIDEVQDGAFLTEENLRLPDETTAGEKLRWVETKESKELIWLFLGVIGLLFALWKQDLAYKQLIKEREQRIKQVYPEFMNELVILVGAGLSLPAAWKRIGQDYQKKREEGGEINPLYEEIYRESRELDAGTSMREVLEEFTVHIRLKEARRFAVLLVQNLKRGDAFLISRLKELNQEAWNLRKKQVREKTEEADTKLLLPLMLMLVVVLIIVLSPAMITMQV